tara:strand:- start:26928 stop:27551 length:624 start_codon:yes stop_codon:yes gene_type:complete
MLSIGEAAKKVGVHPQTLRVWEKEGKLTPQKTSKGHRRYTIQELSKVTGNVLDIKRDNVIYARVSSRKQEGDLDRQIEFMQKLFPMHEVIKDIGSGINFKRPGLQSLLERVCTGTIGTIAISYKDRLCRIGFDLFESICTIFGSKIFVINNIETSPEKELVEDLIAITTSFSARMHGLRKYRSQMSEDFSKAEEMSEGIMEKMDAII